MLPSGLMIFRCLNKYPTYIARVKKKLLSVSTVKIKGVKSTFATCSKMPLPSLLLFCFPYIFPFDCISPGSVRVYMIKQSQVITTHCQTLGPVTQTQPEVSKRSGTHTHLHRRRLRDCGAHTHTHTHTH